MVLSRPYKRPSDRAFAVFRRRVVEQLAPPEIMKEFGISRARVHFLVRRVVKWSREHEGIGDVLAMKVQHTAMLYDLYRDARTQWKRSCEDATDHTETSVTGLATKDGTPLPDKKTTRVSRRGQSGNPGLMKTLNELLASIRGIWGADAPKQLGVGGPDGGPLTFAAILASAERSGQAIEADAGNVVDVDAELAKIRAEHANVNHG